MIDPELLAILKEPERQAVELCTRLAMTEIRKTPGSKPVASWIATSILDRFRGVSPLDFTDDGARRFVELIVSDVIGENVSREVAGLLASEARAYAARCTAEAKALQTELARRARAKLAGEERDDG